MNDPAPIRRRRLAAWLLANDVPVQADQLADIERLVTNWKGQGPVHVAGAQVTRRAARLCVVKVTPKD
nr:TilS substrate-binding domain-containing protein [Corynebacterium stercoris]